MTEYTISKVRDKDISSAGLNAEVEVEVEKLHYYNYTTAAIEDELLKSFLCSEKNQRFYYAQAEYFIRRINIYNPLPIFVLHTEDIPDELANELQSLGKVTRDRTITNVVRRIYQSVDPDYFAINGIYGMVKWFMMEDTTE
jgi:hypothetical protein